MMNPEFIAILKKLVTEQGKEVLFNSAKCKAFLADYTHGEFKKESRLLIQTVDAGVPKAIDTSIEISQCKKQQIRVLHEDFFITEEVAKDIIDTLVLIFNKSVEQTIVSPQNKITNLDTSNIMSGEQETSSSQNHEVNKLIPPNIVTENHQEQKSLSKEKKQTKDFSDIIAIIIVFTILALLVIIGIIKQ